MIEWCNPYKIKMGGITQWKRHWCIPPDLCSAFFEFWREEKFKLLADGFRVYKEEDDWYLTEVANSVYNFKDIGVVKQLTAPKMSTYVLPPYNLKDPSGLREWQVNAVEKTVAALKEWGSAINGSDLGVGKTFCTCALARELNLKFVVVCPKAVITTWHYVAKEHFKIGDQCLGVINYEKLKTGKISDIATFEKKKYPVKKKNSKRKFITRRTFTWKVPKNTLIIWDESQKLKNWKTQNAKMSREATKIGYKQLFCSATNATTPMELRTVGTALGLFKSGDTAWNEWLRDHGCSLGQFGMQFTENEELREKILKKLNKDLFVDRGVRLRRDEIPNFPDCDLFAVLLDMDKQDVTKINSIYDEMELELKELERLQKLNKKNRLVVELRHRQRIEMIKVPLFIDMVEEAIEEGFSVSLFVNFTDTINALASRLKTDCIFDGNVKDAIRDNNVKLFQDNKEKIILINVMSGGAGLSLHDIHGGHPRMSLISPSYSPNYMRQATGRIWRDGAKTKGIQKLVCVANTVEENVYENVRQKLHNLDLLNDGDLKYSKDYEVVKY